jgi:hypothetical protein
MFGWFKKKDKVNENKVILHEHDLSKWHYLGYTNCRYVDSDGKDIAVWQIFLFVDKNNEKRRSYYVPSDSFLVSNHQYMNMTVKPWAAGEKEIYSIISGKGCYPSDYLKEYMMKKFSVVWSNKKNWWVSDDDAKYEQAVNKQKENIIKTDGNVIQVPFGNKVDS